MTTAQKTQEDRIIEINPIKKSNLKTEITIPESLSILDVGEKQQEKTGIFRIMTEKDGDKRVVWDKHDLKQIKDAKKLFDELIQEGLVPYKVGIDGKASAEVMDVFDSEAEEIIFLPVAAAIVGG